MADAEFGDTQVINIFTALLGIISFCALAGTAISRILFRSPKVWNEENEEWLSEQTDEYANYEELRKEKPHIWID